MVFLPGLTLGKHAMPKAGALELKCLPGRLDMAREMRSESARMWISYQPCACDLAVVHSGVYASLAPVPLAPGLQSGETCRKLDEQGSLQPQELCTRSFATRDANRTEMVWWGWG